MSRRRREQEEHERMAQIYDKFAQYVRRTMRDNRRNPNLDVRDFSQMPPPGVTHMEAVLEHVDKGHKSLYSMVESFANGAYLETREDLKTGSDEWVAFIPFKTSSSKRSYETEDVAQPSNLSTQLLILGLFVLLGIGFFTTSQAQLNYLLNKPL